MSIPQVFDTITNPLSKMGMGQVADSIVNPHETIHEYVCNYFKEPWFSNGFSDFCTMFVMSVVCCIFGVIVAGLFGALLWKGIYKKNLKFWGMNLHGWFIAVWIYGFLVYDIGMCTGEWISLLTNAPLAIIYGFKIFLLDSDVSEIHEVFHRSWFYSLNFALAHFFAAIISTLFVIKYFGFNILAKLRLYKVRRYGNSVDETYVMWGLNDASVEMINSINEHYAHGDDKKSYRIILVRLNEEDDDSHETHSGIGRLLDFLSIPSSDLDKLNNLNCLTTGTYTNIRNLNTKDKFADLLGSSLKLNTLRRILDEKTAKKIHFIFLGDDEKENLHAVSLLLHDSTLNAFTQKTFLDADNTEQHCKVVLYCHARYNSVHRVIEDRYMGSDLCVKVIDSSHISVENLKLDKNLLPVNFVKVGKDATVSSAFNSLVVGFSEVGQDSVKFLYEYGAFVKSGSTDTDVRRSEFHMQVVDKHMDDVAGPFVAGAPAITVSMPFLRKDGDAGDAAEEKSAPIVLHKLDCEGVAFYGKLKDWVKTLNYVVIATDNDERNISLAIRILKMAIRYRENMDNLCILARVREDEDGDIRKTAEYYNRLWKAQCAVNNYDGKIGIQTEVKRGDEAEKPIHLFGLDKETYTYKNVIDDSMERQAVEFKERYTASTEDNYVRPQTMEDYAWFKEVRKYITCIGNDPEINPTLSAVMGIRRMQGQDYANCFHAATKRLIAEKALEEAGLPKDFPWESLARDKDTTAYRVKDGVAVAPQVFGILNVLAQTEHLRWNASHEILGYIRGGASRSEIRMHHPCIRVWQDLSTDTQGFDYNFVDLVLNIINPDRPIEKQ